MRVDLIKKVARTRGGLGILQDIKAGGLSAPRSHEFPSPAAGPPLEPEPAALPGGPPRILQRRECSCSTKNNFTHAAARC